MKLQTTLLTIALITACTPKNPTNQIPPPTLRVMITQTETLPSKMEFVGQTHSLTDVKISPRINSYITSINYAEGMPVKKGQILFTLDAAPMQVALAEAEATLSSAKSQLVEAQNSYDRSVPLARMNAISQSALDQATASLASAKASVKSAQANLRNAKLNLSYTKITAPWDGVIGQTNGSIGDYVGPSTEFSVLNTVSNIDSIYVYLSIPTARYLSIVKKDSTGRPMYQNDSLLSNIEMTLADGSLYPHKGQYKFTERAVNSQTGAVVIHVLFPNPDRSLKAGQYVRLSSDVGAAIGAILVPQRSVVQSQGLSNVFVVRPDSTVEYRKVTLGDTYGDRWAITSGLKANEMVLTEGVQKVRNGMRIKIKN